MKIFKLIIVGAGASGLVCAARLAKDGFKDILIIEGSDSPARKLLASGGGKSNFTNINIKSDNYISDNNHFIKSALSRYPSNELMHKVLSADIRLDERTHGRIFCEDSSYELLDLLLEKTKDINIIYSCKMRNITKDNDYFTVESAKGEFYAENVLLATGSTAAPDLGGTDSGMVIAKNFGHKIIPIRPGLIPLKTNIFSELSGISLNVKISCEDKLFVDDLLFTHTGISGPAALQISSYWNKDTAVYINFLPNLDILQLINSDEYSKSTIGRCLADNMPARLVKHLVNEGLRSLKCTSAPRIHKQEIAEIIHNFSFTPTSTDFFKKAEVMLGGVDTATISSKDMQSKMCNGLYFSGEVMDITGELGGYNLHWAYASGMAVAECLLKKV